MMTAAVDPEKVREITDWIERQARAMNVPVTVYPSGVRPNGDWFHVPVAVESEEAETDAYDRAVILQRIEDAWNDAPPLGGVNLFLVPAKHSEAAKQDRYEKIEELMARQRQILGRMDPNGMAVADAPRYHAIRQELEETLDEMARLFPSLATDVP